MKSIPQFHSPPPVLTNSLPLSSFAFPAVWERLEAENPEFFAAYNAQLEATAQMERCTL